MTVIEILRKARAMVARPNGWCQGRYGTAERCCMIGALNLASGSEAQINGESPERERAIDLLTKVTKADFLSTWNDAGRRTQGQVVAAFTRAIALARRRTKKRAK